MRDFTRDPEALRALEADPLTLGEVQPARTVAALLDANRRMRRDFPNITLPLLVLHGTADNATVPAGSEFFYGRAGSRDKTLKLYQGHYHDLLNDLGQGRGHWPTSLPGSTRDWLDSFGGWPSDSFLSAHLLPW